MDKRINRIKNAILNKTARKIGKTALALGMLANVYGTGFAAREDSTNTPITNSMNQQNAFQQFQQQQIYSSMPAQLNQGPAAPRPQFVYPPNTPMTNYTNQQNAPQQFQQQPIYSSMPAQLNQGPAAPRPQFGYPPNTPITNSMNQQNAPQQFQQQPIYSSMPAQLNQGPAAPRPQFVYPQNPPITNSMNQQNAPQQFQQQPIYSSMPVSARPTATTVAVQQAFNKCEVFKKAYLSVTNPGIRYVKECDKADFREADAIACYQVLVNTFNAVGQQDLLERMKSDSSAAINEFYKHISTNQSLGKNIKGAFYLLANTLNTLKLKTNVYDSKWKKKDCSEFCSLAMRDLEQLRIPDETLYQSLSTKNPYIREFNRRYALQQTYPPSTTSARESIAQTLRNTYTQLFEHLDEQYSLTEALNFTINYIVYGIGLENIDTPAIQTYFNLSFIHQHRNLATGYLDGLMKLITNVNLNRTHVLHVPYPKSDDSCVAGICTAIDNCISNSSKIKDPAIAFHENSKYVFTMDKHGYVDPTNQIKAINFVEYLLDIGTGTIADIPLMNLSSIIGYALYGTTWIKPYEFIEAIEKYNDSRKITASYESKRQLWLYETEKLIKAIHQKEEMYEKAINMLKQARIIAQYKEQLNDFLTNSQEITWSEEFKERNNNSLLFLATVVKRHLQLNAAQLTDAQVQNAPQDKVQNALQYIWTMLRGTDVQVSNNHYDVQDRPVQRVSLLYNISDLYDTLKNDMLKEYEPKFSGENLISIVYKLLNNQDKLSAFTRMVS